MAASDVAHGAACANCHRNAATHLCSRCRAVAYCTPACQAAHWSDGAHKHDCVAPFAAEHTFFRRRSAAPPGTVGAMVGTERVFTVGGLLLPLATTALSRRVQLYINTHLLPPNAHPLDTTDTDFLYRWLDLDAARLGTLETIGGGLRAMGGGNFKRIRDAVALLDVFAADKSLFVGTVNTAEALLLLKATAEGANTAAYMYRFSTTFPFTLTVNAHLIKDADKVPPSFVPVGPRRQWRVAKAGGDGMYRRVTTAGRPDTSRNSHELGASPREFMAAIERWVADEQQAYAHLARTPRVVLLRPTGAAQAFFDVSPPVVVGGAARAVTTIGNPLEFREGARVNAEVVGSGAVVSNVGADGALVRVGHLLGAGDLGEVYAATLVRSGAPDTSVALKVFYGGDAFSVVAFLQEMFVHENLEGTPLCAAGGVAVCASFALQIGLPPGGTAGGPAPRTRFALVFPFVNNAETLDVAALRAQKAARSRVELHKRNAVRLLRIVAYKFMAAVGKLHALGVFHLDIKSDNAVLGGGEQVTGADEIKPVDVTVRMIDFGSGCARDARFAAGSKARLAAIAKRYGVPDKQLEALQDDIVCERRSLFSELLRGAPPAKLPMRTDIMRTALTLMRLAEGKGGFPNDNQLAAAYAATPIDKELYDALSVIARGAATSDTSATRHAALLEELYNKL